MAHKRSAAAVPAAPQAPTHSPAGGDGCDAQVIESAQDPLSAKTESGDTHTYAQELGVLNRHWYRRCLDALGTTLQDAGSEPSVQELKDLCDRIITGFLTAVTGQAPDSNQPQFPADRAYYIPFQGDNSARFNFSKPYYQVVGQPGNPYTLDDSLWSFLPWFRGPGAATGLDPGARHAPRVLIANRDSVNEKQQTISFGKMISVQERHRRDELVPSTARNSTATPERASQHDLLLKKSLLLRGDNDPSVLELFTEKNPRTATLHDEIKAALVEVFEIYREAPGNAAIELLLQNHLQVLRWLSQVSGLTRTNSNAPGVVSQRGEHYKELMPILLRAYFIPDDTPELGSRQEDLLKLLKDLHELLKGSLAPEKRAADGPGASEPRVEAAEALRKLAHELLRLGPSPSGGKSPFHRDVEEKIERKGVPATPPADRAEPTIETFFHDQLVQIWPHLKSFYQYFLEAGIEVRLERDLAASLDGDPRRAGSSKASFVWVTPDFADLAGSLPKNQPLRQKDPAARKDLTQRLHRITGPYVRFFQEFEVRCLEQYRRDISNYWRIRGQANRRDWIFASFDDPDSQRKLLVLPCDEMEGQEFVGNAHPEHLLPRQDMRLAQRAVHQRTVRLHDRPRRGGVQAEGSQSPPRGRRRPALLR